MYVRRAVAKETAPHTREHPPSPAKRRQRAGHVFARASALAYRPFAPELESIRLYPPDASQTDRSLLDSLLGAVTDFRNNHYVPRWYQERFLPADGRERKFYYLDLKPDRVRTPKRVYTRAALLRWGPARCFVQRDLYTTFFKEWMSTDIERRFFGRVDQSAKSAIEYFSSFEHPSVDGKAFDDFLLFMSLQKLRTPKGLSQVAEMVGRRDQLSVLQAMQQLQRIYCAIWTESVWSIADASDSDVKFIVSDHPVTIYNKSCFPGSSFCRGYRDPDIRFVGSHTLFPLGLDKILILTNLSWVRNPYMKPISLRPNPNFFRDAMFYFMAIQTRRSLQPTEVHEINYVIKSRAYRYVAAAEEEWLYPERHIPTPHWDRLGKGYLFMPDPRSVPFSSGMMVGYEDGSTRAFDEYGRRPGQPGFRSSPNKSAEWDSYLAFKGEFARVFGPARRGRGFEVGGRDFAEDSPEMHAYYLGLESKYKAKINVSNRRKRKKRR